MTHSAFAIGKEPTAEHTIVKDTSTYTRLAGFAGAAQQEEKMMIRKKIHMNKK